MPRMRVRAVRTCSNRAMASVRRPAERYVAARLLRMVRVLGWSSPRMRMLSVRTCSNKAMASVRCPAERYVAARLLREPRVLG